MKLMSPMIALFVFVAALPASAQNYVSICGYCDDVTETEAYSAYYQFLSASGKSSVSYSNDPLTNGAAKYPLNDTRNEKDFDSGAAVMAPIQSKLQGLQPKDLDAQFATYAKQNGISNNSDQWTSQYRAFRSKKIMDNYGNALSAVQPGGVLNLMDHGYQSPNKSLKPEDGTGIVLLASSDSDPFDLDPNKNVLVSWNQVIGGLKSKGKLGTSDKPLRIMTETCYGGGVNDAIIANGAFNTCAAATAPNNETSDIVISFDSKFWKNAKTDKPTSLGQNFLKTRSQLGLTDQGGGGLTSTYYAQKLMKERGVTTTLPPSMQQIFNGNYNDPNWAWMKSLQNFEMGNGFDITSDCSGNLDQFQKQLSQLKALNTSLDAQMGTGPVEEPYKSSYAYVKSQKSVFQSSLTTTVSSMQSLKKQYDDLNKHIDSIKKNDDWYKYWTEGDVEKLEQQKKELLKKQDELQKQTVSYQKYMRQMQIVFEGEAREAFLNSAKITPAEKENFKKLSKCEAAPL